MSTPLSSIATAEVPHSFWRGLSRPTRIGAIVGAIATIAALGPVAVAMLMLRCCQSSSGASAGAWVIVGVVVALAGAAGALAAGLLVAGVQHLRRGGIDRAAWLRWAGWFTVAVSVAGICVALLRDPIRWDLAGRGAVLMVMGLGLGAQSRALQRR